MSVQIVKIWHQTFLHSNLACCSTAASKFLVCRSHTSSFRRWPYKYFSYSLHAANDWHGKIYRKAVLQLRHDLLILQASSELIIPSLSSNNLWLWLFSKAKCWQLSMHYIQFFKRKLLAGKTDVLLFVSKKETPALKVSMCQIVNLQWIVRNFLALNGSCKAGCSASQRIVVPSSDFDTGKMSLDMEVQVLMADPPGREFSWVCPERISWSLAYHLKVGGGFPPVAMHSISKSSPAEAMMWSAVSPTRWITISSGFSAMEKMHSVSNSWVPFGILFKGLPAEPTSLHKNQMNSSYKICSLLLGVKYFFRFCALGLSLLFIGFQWRKIL